MMKAGKIYRKIAAILILAAIFFLGLHSLKEAPYRIRVVYDQVDDEGELYSQLFYSTYTKNNPWREKMSFMGFIDGNEACFVIPMELFEDIYSFRFDPVQKKTDLSLLKVVFCKGFIPVKAILPEEFMSRISNTVNARLRLENGHLSILPTQDDSQLYLYNEFDIDWEKKVFTGWLVILAGGIVPVFFLTKRLAARIGRKIADRIKTKLNEDKYRRLADRIIQRGLKLCRTAAGRLELFQSCFEKYPKRCAVLAAVSLAVLMVFLFLGYLTGEKYWIFTGIASDSYGQIFPNYYNAARRIEEGCNAAGWNFLAGLGNRIGKFYPSVNNWILFWGTESLPYLFAVSYILKMILSGVIFYFYLRVVGRRKITSLVFAAGYAFCGHMVIRGRWENMPREVLLAAILLLCFELYFMKKDMRWLPLAIILFVSNSSSYALLLYGVVFCGYAFFRYFTEREFRLRDFMRFAGGLLFCLLLALPIAIWNLEGIVSSVGSSRFQSGVSGYTNLVGQERDWLIGLDSIQSAFFRTIGISIVGMETAEFSGVINGLEDPTFYCGLMTLLMIPAAFGKEDKKKRYWYLGGLGAAALYFFVNPIRLLAGGMSGDSTFKISSFWIIVLFLYIGSDGLEHFLRNSLLIKRVLLTAAIIMAVAAAFALAVNPDILFKYLAYSFVFILAYAAVLAIYSKRWSRDYRFSLLAVLGGLCLLEPAALAYDHINAPTAVKNDGARTGLEDYSIEALAFIRKEAGDEGYRIDKQYESYGRCDSLYQGYMGTRSYVGGLGIRSEIIELYEALALPKMAVSNILGSSASDEANTLSGVRYILSNTSMIPNYGYICKGTVENIWVYENQYALPLVYGYSACMYRSDFEKLSVQDRRDAMLRYCIVEEGEGDRPLPCYEGGSVDREQMLENFAIEWRWVEDTIRFDKNTEGNVIVLKVKTDSRGSDKARNYVFFRESAQESGVVEIGIPEGEEELLLAFNQEDICELEFDLGEDVSLKVLSMARIPQEIYYQYYRECVEGLREIEAEDILIREADSSMTGRITVKAPTQLCFSIPYDEGWKLYLNGKETELEKENIGFVGAYCSEGEYEFELKYTAGENRLKSYATGIGTGICVLNALIWSGVYHRRRKGKGKKWENS